MINFKVSNIQGGSEFVPTILFKLCKKLPRPGKLMTILKNKMEATELALSYM